jgi:adenylate kinase family enzyme
MSSVTPEAKSEQPQTAIASELDPALHRVMLRVRLLAKRRVAWLRHLWFEEISVPTQTGSMLVSHAEVDSILEGKDSPEAEAAWFAQHEFELQKSLEELDAAMASDRSSRFFLLHQIFGLDAADSDLLQICLALSLDPALARAYAYLQDHAGRTYATEELAARLCGHGPCGAWSADSPLFRWELILRREVSPGEPPLLASDPHIRNWLMGFSGMDEVLVDVAHLQMPLPPLTSWPVAETMEWAQNLLNRGQQGRVLVRVQGIPGSGRKTLAAVVASRLGLPLLLINADAVEDDAWTRLYVHAQRQAFLDRSALAWCGESLSRRPWPAGISGFPVQFLITDPTQTIPPHPGCVEYEVGMSELGSEERLNIWKQYLPESVVWPATALRQLAACFRVTVGEIAAVAAKQPANAEQAGVFIREQARHRLGRLAQYLDCPFMLDDLVVVDHVRRGLDDFIFEARERISFWEKPEARRLFPQGRGLMALFSGPSGTGKTMAAQVIAASLGLDLFRIDLSAVVSKYVGETSQNLERILSRAEGMDVVLFFDEADSLFGKRTDIKDAHDRFANTDTNYLLQAIENYQGIAILATNQKGQMDTAFTRRIRYMLEFNRPDVAQRLLIWQKIIGELADAERLRSLDASLQTLALEMDVTGAQIKYAVLSALFIARRRGELLNPEHLVGGLERELMKEGKAFSERERGRLYGQPH